MHVRRLRASASLRVEVSAHPQEGSEPGLNALNNLYIPTSILAICFSGPCPQPAFFSRRTRITPSTYVYTFFVSDFVLATSVAVGMLSVSLYNTTSQPRTTSVSQSCLKSVLLLTELC